MTNAIGSAWRSFWHTMTSNDRHASHDSPYRTGQHVPLSQSRHEPLTSVATSALESRADLTSPYEEEYPTNGSPTGLGSPTRPYSPGMRSLSSQKRRSNDQGADGAGEIQMQSFHAGAPPPPPITHSWSKIDRWAEKNYEELWDQLCEGCTQNDINELEHELDCTLPLEVRESLSIHDGQERGGLPTGIIFGCMLLDCEEVVQEWKNWRTVNEEFLGSTTLSQGPPPKAFGGSSSASPAQQMSNPLWRQELLDRQDSQPPRAIQKAYAHPGWIPLARDWGGNCIAVDLAPGPAGKWGQVIIFGRDYDCKYVVARSWASFLATVADDITSDKVFVDEETGELKLKEFKNQNVEPPYLEILRWRTDQKYGRRPPRRKAPNGLGVNTNPNRASRESPYGSPTPSEERGRSPHRLSARGPNHSPKGQFGISSPLARVTEEAASPISTTAVGETSRDAATKDNGEDLIQVTTPRVLTGEEEPAPEKAASETEKEEQDTAKEKASEKDAKRASVIDDIEGEMKNVAI